MSVPKKEVEAVFYTHALLWALCSHQLGAAESDRAAAFNFRLVTMVFAFFTLEAYLNHLGQLILPTFWEREREFFRSSGTFGKLDVLAEICGVSFEKAKRPYQTLKSLQHLRNLLAHGRTERVTTRAKIPPGKLPSLQARIERLVGSNRAQRAVEDVRDAILKMNLAARRHFPNRGIAEEPLDPCVGEFTWTSVAQPNCGNQR